MHQSQSHLIVLLIYILGTLTCKAQLAFDFAKVDSISYKLYEDKNWKELGKFCNKVINLNMDYYYLRMRAGIAFYEQKKYRAAAVHFQKAVSNNSNDEIAQTYLYYSYLNTARNEEAFNVLKSKKGEPKFPIKLNNFTLESGIKVGSYSNFNSAFIQNASLQHSLGKSISLLHSINYYSQSETRFDVSQLQYYLRLTMALKYNFKIILGGHFINDNDYLKVYEVKEPKGYTHPAPPNTYTYNFVPQGVPFTTILTKKTNNSYIAAFNFIKHSRYFDFNFGATVSNLDTTHLYQANAGFNFFPLQNNELQIGLQLYENNYQQSTLRFFSFAPQVITRLWKKLYLSLNYFNNNLNRNVNITEQTGLLFNNSVDYTSQRFAITPSYFVNRHLNIYLTYAYEEKIHFIINYPYNYQICLTGLKYNF